METVQKETMRTTTIIRRRTLYRTISAIYAKVDKLLDRKQASGELQATCRGAGCNWCCYEWLEVTPAEAAVVGVAIAELPPDIKAKVRANWARWKENLGDMPPTTTHVQVLATQKALKRNHKKATQRNLRKRERMGEKMKRAALKGNTPCPLLVDGKCSIYADRPWNCRGYFSRSDPEKCKEIGKAHIGTVFESFETAMVETTKDDPVQRPYTMRVENYYPVTTLVHGVERIFGPILDDAREVQHDQLEHEDVD